MDQLPKLQTYKEQLSKNGTLLLCIRLSPGVSPSKLKEIITENIDGKDIELWRIQVSAPPEDGRANDELIKLLASLFDVRKNTIKIQSGTHSRDKLVCIILADLR